MLLRLRLALAAGSLVAVALTATRAARAQAITASGQLYAERFINGQDVGQSTRPVNLNPLGINYSDCEQDMVLQFSVTLSGFTGQDNMQVWASYQGDCTADATRGTGTGTNTNQATCWLVNAGLTLPLLSSATTQQFNVPVRALVGPEGGIPLAGTLVGDQGIGACSHQASYAAQSITVWFLPIAPGGLLDTSGTPYSYPVISADLVGPPAPAGVSIGDGDTVFVVNWTPNTDADTQGYDVFIDPPPGSASTAQTSVTYCPSTPASSSSSSGGSSTVDASAEDAALDGADDTAAGVSDATVATSSTAQDAAEEAYCFKINGGGSLVPSEGGGSCESVALNAPPVFTVGTATTTTIVEDSGVVVTEDAAVTSGTSEDAAVAESGLGGISSIDCQYLSGSSCSAGTPAYTNTQNPSVTGLSASTFTIKGLTDGDTYNVVVAAVDGSGNVGPQSSPVQCAVPAPINDFYKVYRLAGGTAGGGFCALDAAGAPVDPTLLLLPVAATVFGLARRRRRR